MSTGITLSWVIVGVVLAYYAGTKGVFVLTRRYKGRWQRRALISLSFAVLFTPSVIGITGSHGGGLIPAPAWAAVIVCVAESEWKWFFASGLCPIAICWVAMFSISSWWPKKQKQM